MIKNIIIICMAIALFLTAAVIAGVNRSRNRDMVQAWYHYSEKLDQMKTNVANAYFVAGATAAHATIKRRPETFRDEDLFIQSCVEYWNSLGSASPITNYIPRVIP